MTRIRLPLAALGCALLLAIGACGEGSVTPGAREAEAPPAAPGPPEAPPAPTPAAASDGAALYAQRCATCHGAAGDGKGPGGAGLAPPPRDFRDPAWQASVSDAHIEGVIAGGGPSVGLSPLMPAQADLAARPAELAALRTHVRGFRP